MPHKKKSTTQKVAAGTSRGVVSRPKPINKPKPKPKKVAARKKSKKSRKV